MKLSRRGALKAAGAALTGVAAPARVEASSPRSSEDSAGMLYDATLCIGCKSCMVACNEANDLPPDTRLSGGRTQMPLDLNEYTKNIIQLYQDEESGERSFVKRQCMHCVDPACAAACMLGALKKREHDIVTYDATLCVGCRYCEMACPFGVPKFEWEKLAPKIVKCELCSHLIARGGRPACVTACPTRAVIYGTRGELLDEAHRRLADKPASYVPRVYGEHEAGGTQVLYLSAVEFDKLGLPDVGDEPVPERVRRIQSTVYQGFAAPVVLYAILAGVLVRNRRRADAEPEPAEDER